MKYALNLAEDGRLLSATYEQYADADAVLRDKLPTGETEREKDIHNWRDIDGEYVYDPLPVEPVLAAEARAKRDKLLDETDWTQTLDAPISAECREAFRVYRQALRDITEQEGFPETIEWPTAPEAVKAAPDPVDTAVDVLLGGDEA